MTEFGGPIKVDGPVSASQATKEGECVVLGEGAKIPPGLYDSISGGYFEALNPADLPQDFAEGDIILAILNVHPGLLNPPESWDEAFNNPPPLVWNKGVRNACVVWGRIDINGYTYNSPVYSEWVENEGGAVSYIIDMNLRTFYPRGSWNDSRRNLSLIGFDVKIINGTGASTGTLSISTNQMGNYVSDLYRMRAPSQ